LALIITPLTGAWYSGNEQLDKAPERPHKNKLGVFAALIEKYCKCDLIIRFRK